MQVLHLSHNGMTEPLGQSQVLPYARGLARLGWRIDILSFEPATTPDATLAALRRELARDDIGYSWLRRSPSHALTVKAFEIARAFGALARRGLRHRPSIIHARGYLPAPPAKLLAALAPDAKFLFDCRGLLGDEFVDTGYWQRDGQRYRMLKRAERYLFSHADGLVVLTHRLHHWLVEETGMVSPRVPVEVVPCCVDLDRFRPSDETRERARALIAAGDRFVLAYAGNLGSWYCEEEMTELFAALRRRRPALLLILTRASTAKLEAALARRGVPPQDVVLRAVEPSEVPHLLLAADAAVSFALPCFAKIASSPIKVAEYLALGLPVVMNRGVGDFDEILDHVEATVDAGQLTSTDLERAAERLAILDGARLRTVARAAATTRFSLADVGIPRYHRVYLRLAHG